MAAEKAHDCRLKGDHLHGVECLSNEQLVPILLAMDPDTILNCGRASPRLYSLVCSREVWRHLLTGVEFTKERLEELLIFGKGLFEVKGIEIKGSSEMMPEVVKEAARRFALVSRDDYTKDQPMVSIAIQGCWGTPVTFDMLGNHLEELTRVAEAVGAKFNITACDGDLTGVSDALWCMKYSGGLDWIGGFNNVEFQRSTFQKISAHIAEQEENVFSLKLNRLFLPSAGWGIVPFLQRASKEWSILHLDFRLPWPLVWDDLARASVNGSIGTLSFSGHTKASFKRVVQDDVKRVWRITEKIVWHEYGSPQIEIGGGKGADTEVEWQRLLELAFEV